MSRTHDVTISAFDLDRLERELATVTEQRDRAQSKIENQAERIKYLEGATNHATGTPLSKMREQRDRLAEALREIAEGSPWGRRNAIRIAEQALTAVEGGPQ
jgi:septal ring factor EnvC (AmiA/AmiB activator)